MEITYIVDGVYLKNIKVKYTPCEYLLAEQGMRFLHDSGELRKADKNLLDKMLTAADKKREGEAKKGSKAASDVINVIDFERKWLYDAGHRSKDIDIALNAIKSKVKEVLEKNLAEGVGN
jgi:hypothetical protein